MALEAIGTHKSGKTDKPAVTIRVDGRTFSLSHEQVSDRTGTQIVADLESAASLSGVDLPRLYVHVNRDGSLAVATGREPETWPEDWRDG